MERASFGLQLRSLLRRNLMIKLHSRTQTITEFVWPVFFILLLALIKQLSTPDVETSAIRQPLTSKFKLGNARENRILIPVAPFNFFSYPFMFDVVAQMNPSYNGSLVLIPFEDETEMDSWFDEIGVNASAILSGVIFHDVTLSNYTLKPLYNDSALTDELRTGNEMCRKGSQSCPSELYLKNGLLELQATIDSLLLSTKYNVSQPDLLIQMMPKDKFTGDSTYIRSFAPIFYVLTYSFFVQFLVVNLVTEKKEKIKETMRIMGMRDSAFWLAWIIVYAVIVIIITVFAALVAYLTNFLSEKSDVKIFGLLLLLYGFSVICFSFALTPFFNNPKIAGPFASMSTTVIGILYFAVSLSTTYDVDGLPHSPIPAEAQWVLCLFSPLSVALGVERALYLDISQIGLTWDSISFGSSQSDALPFYAHLIMLSLDILLYFFLAVYLDSVIPGEYGQRKHPLFCIMPSYWSAKPDTDEEMQYSSNICQSVEEVPTDLDGKNFIRLNGISKTYGRNKKKCVTAVNNLSLQAYEGQITCILGHNGAGKTTLMNMLTGLIPPSSGDASIYGYSISDSNGMNQIRSMIGVCPQHNVLLNELSVYEHLRFFAGLKGIPSNIVDQKIDEILRDFDLVDKAKCKAKDLSGGQKRKLCVGISFIGDPKVIILDEPTAGMDPHSRRQLWSLLKQKKTDRVILLTTHFMDEADILADRKAVVSKGELKCCGSSLYLKTKFGAGYHLNMVSDSQTSDMDKLSDVIKQYVPGAKLNRRHGAEVSFTLPYDQVPHFPDLFNHLADTDGNEILESLGICSYGISMTTLEEVFLKLGDQTSEPGMEADEEDEQETAKLVGDGDMNSSSSCMVNDPLQSVKKTSKTPNKVPDLDAECYSTTVSGSKLKRKQLWTLIKLRFLLIMRNKAAFFGRILLPVILMFAGLAVIKYSIPDNPSVDPPSLKMNGTQLIEGPLHPVAVIQNTSDDIELFVKSLEDVWSPGVSIYDSSVNLLDVKPHEIGFTVNSFSPDEPYDSEVVLNYNSSWQHTLPLLVNTLTNTFIKIADENGNDSSVIETYIQPFKSISPQPAFQSNIFAFSLMIGVAVVIVPASFASEVVRDRECKARSQLRISGVSSTIYWLSTWIVDLLQGYLLSALLIVLIVAFQITPLVTDGALICTSMFFILYMPLYMSIAYALSYLFNKYEVVSGVLPTVFMLLCMLPYMFVAILAFTPDKPDVQSTAKYLHYVNLAINPIYSCAGFFFMVNKLHLIESYKQQTLTPIVSFEMYMDWDNLIRHVFIPPVIWFVILAVIMRLAEFVKFGGNVKSVCNQGSPQAFVNTDQIPDEDEDVMIERHTIEKYSGQAKHHQLKPIISVHGLRKDYKGKNGSKKLCAVRNMSFGVRSGEVFGLLGPNGAGKSTMLNMLTAETSPTAGQVIIDGKTVSSSSNTSSLAGYCPQFDALWGCLTLKEHLRVYGSLRGWKSDVTEKFSEHFIQSLELESHRNKKADALSGGTKRKLSFIMSLLGKPKVVMLDEPSTGMDPRSKRVFWNCISQTFSSTDRGAILTTHYMEEAEALCTRTAIVVNGVMQCIGTNQHLKNKFGSGYTLELKLKDHVSESTDVKIREMFLSSICLEKFSDRAVYRIHTSDITSLGDAFSKLENAREAMTIVDYSLSQATLEQVFLEFAKHQATNQELVESENADVTHIRKNLQSSSQSADTNGYIKKINGSLTHTTENGSMEKLSPPFDDSDGNEIITSRL